MKKVKIVGFQIYWQPTVLIVEMFIKAELFMDFHVTEPEDVEGQVDEYIKFFNEERPAYSLSYLTPKQYREEYEMRTNSTSCL